MNTTLPWVFEHIGPDQYRVLGGSANSDSVWTYKADIDALGELSNMATTRCGLNLTNAPPSCMLRTSDQGMLVAFKLAPPGNSAFAFAKQDMSGVVQWQRNYPDVYGSWMVDSQRALAEKDGHYFTLGRVTTVPGTEGNASTMVELDSIGACVTQRIWAGGDIWSGDGAGIVRTADNGLLTVAVEHVFYSQSSFPAISVQRWDDALQVVWSNRYSLGYYHDVVRPFATADGGALIVGRVLLTYGGGHRTPSSCGWMPPVRSFGRDWYSPIAMCPPVRWKSRTEVLLSASSPPCPSWLGSATPVNWSRCRRQPPYRWCMPGAFRAIIPLESIWSVVRETTI